MNNVVHFPPSETMTPLDVVVERDWPEYELVWNMIEDRASEQAAG